MYICDLTVRNVKLLRNVTLPFLRQGKPRMWTVLLGENGLCKTTILQTIAMAASGMDRANQLADIPSLPDRRLKEPDVTVSASFSFGRHVADRVYPNIQEGSRKTAGVRSQLTLPAGWSVFEGTSNYIGAGQRQSRYDPLRLARAENLKHWFVAGYGVQRSLPLPQTNTEYTSDSALDRLATLFNKGRIIGTSFADMFAQTTLGRTFNRRLQQALVTQHHLLPKITALELRGRGGVRSALDLVESHRFSLDLGNGLPVKIPAIWLSQGYQGMIAWVADLIGQQLWEDGSSALDRMEGLVLIDELDLFLHPAWQVTLVRTLRKTFPRIQFVVTTHSPMVLTGCERDEVFILEMDGEGNVQAKQAPAAPGLMSGSELYKVFFGVDGLYPTEAGDILQRFGFIASNPHRTEAEEREMRGLLRELRKRGVEPEWQPARREAR